MYFYFAFRRLAPISLILLLLSACEVTPTIRMAETPNLTPITALATEITKRLIVEGFGYQIQIVKTEGADLFNQLAEGKIDLALFVQKNASPWGIPSQCTEASKELVALGQGGDDDLNSRVARCDLSNTAKDLFDALSKIKFKTSDLEDALFWQQDNKATTAQSAIYFLHNNQTQWKKWIPESGIQSVKSIIAREIEVSKLQF